MKLCDLDEIKICVNRQYENCHGYSGNKKAIYREAILAVKSILHSAKSIDAIPVRHGHWCWDGRFRACSICGSYVEFTETLGASHWKYCPNCGAKMDGGTD